MTKVGRVENLLQQWRLGACNAIGREVSQLTYIYTNNLLGKHVEKQGFASHPCRAKWQVRLKSELHKYKNNAIKLDMPTFDERVKNEDHFMAASLM